jgi:hypothetical protein
VAGEKLVERLLHGPQLRLVERALRVDRRVAGGEQQPVALAQWHPQALGQVQHHPLARARTAGFHETEVARRDARVQRQVELAEAAAGSPGLQERSDSVHAASEQASHRW